MPTKSLGAAVPTDTHERCQPTHLCSQHGGQWKKQGGWATHALNIDQSRCGWVGHKKHMAKWLRGAMHMAKGSEVQQAQRCCIASTWPRGSEVLQSKHLAKQIHDEAFDLGTAAGSSFGDHTNTSSTAEELRLWSSSTAVK